MIKIGLLSDTHGDLDPKIFHYFKDVDEIWHAGDIGSLDVLDQLQKFKPTKAVFGNIDNNQIRQESSEFLEFYCEKVKVLITHIGGRAQNYNPKALEQILRSKPNLFICGHSHILLVKMDSINNMLVMNPGACGNKGFHQVKTLLRFSIHGEKIQDLEAIEIGKRV